MLSKKRSRFVTILFLTPLLAVALWLRMPSSAQAATVTSLVFNNVSNSAALNATPASWTEVDDLSVTPGGTLYLPASASVQALAGWVVLDNGAHEPFVAADYTVTSGTTSGDYTLHFAREGVGNVTVHESRTVPGMFIKTGSGLAAIEANKDYRDTGASMAMVDAQANAVYNSALAEMKGRGNSTWTYPKKPYQIKLGSSTELVPTAGAAKTWILLANYLDASLVRNELAYNLEGDSFVRAGVPDYAIKGRMIDLFIDGGFRGSYYLTEKVQVGPTRVAISDLEKANETANPSLSLSSVAPVKVSSLAGAPGIREAQYVPFPTTPADYTTSGYLFEMDFASGSRGERSYVITRHGTPFTVTSPENANLPEVSFAGNYLQKIEDAIYSSTGKNADGVSFSDLIDVDSWARYYVIQEMLGNDDGFKSSTYFYMDQGGKLKAGPLWDCDRSLGSLKAQPPAGSVYVADPSRLQPQWITQLLASPLFRTAVQKAYAEVVGPAVDSILVSGGKLAQYADEVSRSAVLNRLRWAPSSSSVAYLTPAEDIAYLRAYLTQRDAALGTLFGPNYLVGVQLAKGYYTIKNGALALDVASSSLASGANVQIWTPNRSGAQTFLVERGSDALYTITNVNSLKVLNVQGSVAANSTNVGQLTPNGTLAQKWRISTFDGRNYTVVSALGLATIHDRNQAANGYVLDIQGSGTTNGTNVQIYRSNGSAAQRFAFTKVTLAAAPATGGVYTFASLLNTTKVVDVAHSSPLNGANIQLWRSNGTTAQRFTAKNLTNGTTEFWTGTGAGAVIDVARAGMTNGTNVWQYKSNGTAAQQWLARPTGDLNGSYYVVSRVNGLYMDVARSATADGTNVWVWQGNSSAAQKFLLQKVG